MLELVITAWIGALAITTSLFVGIMAVQGVMRQARAVIRSVRRPARVVVDVPAMVPAEVASFGRRAA